MDPLISRIQSPLRKTPIVRWVLAFQSPTTAMSPVKPKEYTGSIAYVVDDPGADADRRARAAKYTNLVHVGGAAVGGTPTVRNRLVARQTIVIHKHRGRVVQVGIGRQR